jgi:hypothetical protein
MAAQIVVERFLDGYVVTGECGDKVEHDSQSLVEEFQAILEAADKVVVVFEVEQQPLLLPLDDSPALLHDRNGYKPLAAVEAVLEAGYGPDEEPDLCAYCHEPVNLGEQIREVKGVPGRMYAHADCGLPVVEADYSWAGQVQ